MRRMLLAALVASILISPLLGQTPRGQPGQSAGGGRGDRVIPQINPSPDKKLNPSPDKQEGGRGSQAKTEPTEATRSIAADFSAAVANGLFVEKSDEFKLGQTVTAGTVAGDTRMVDFQIGTLNGKPAFVSVAVPKSAHDSVETAIKKAIPSIKSQNPLLQMCAANTEQVCVETQDGTCVKWTCVPKKGK